MIDQKLNKYLQGESNYDKRPVFCLKNSDNRYWTGWKEISRQLQEQLQNAEPAKKVIVVECYQGVNDDEIIPALQTNLEGSFFFSREYMLTEKEVNALVYPDVTDDEVFGYITRLTI